jgi:hypothetical protein
MKHPMTAIVALSLGTALVATAWAQATTPNMTSTNMSSTQTAPATGTSSSAQTPSEMQAPPKMVQRSHTERHVGKLHAAKATSLHKKRLATRMSQRTHLAAHKLNGSSSPAHMNPASALGQQQTSSSGSSAPPSGARNTNPASGDIH